MQSQPLDRDPAGSVGPDTSLFVEEPAEPDVPPIASPLPPAGERRRIDLHRRRAIISADRIDIRPSRTTVIPPLFGFFIGAGAVALIVRGVTSSGIPYFLLALLLLFALLAVPLSGITLVYALFGANVIFDRVKQSAAWQQGFLGMGIGTTELVPFWKIASIAVTEAGSAEGAAGSRIGAGSRTEEFAQWEAVLVKQSGTRLTIAGMTVPRRFDRGGFGPVHDLAAAVAALTSSTVTVERVPVPDPPRITSETKMETERAPAVTLRTPRRRRRRN